MVLVCLMLSINSVEILPPQEILLCSANAEDFGCIVSCLLADYINRHHILYSCFEMCTNFSIFYPEGSAVDLNN